ncbi:MAG: hypothetical protein WB698_07225 [Solirubrobacteraceae bacterium]
MIRNFAARKSSSARVLAAAIFACLCLAAAVPAGARANLGTKMYELCSQGKSLAGFTVKQYQIALAQLPTEAREYSSPCVEEIVNAELAAAAHKGHTVDGQSSGSSTGVATPGAGQHVEPTPAQQQILEQTRKSGVGPVHLGGGGEGSVVPGVVHPDLASAASDLPTPVLAVIAAVIAGIALLAGKEINTRMRRSRRG